MNNVSKEPGIKNILSFSKRIKLYEFMKPLLTKLDNDLCKYADGWNDQRVAKECEVNVTNVTSLRQEMFGRLFKKGVNQAKEDIVVSLLQKVIDLEERVDKLEHTTTELRKHLTTVQKLTGDQSVWNNGNQGSNKAPAQAAR